MRERYYRLLSNYYSNNGSFILADDMGLGKTLQSIVVLDIIKSQKTNLIIVPVHLLNKWKKDFDLDHVDVQLIVVDNFDSEETKSAMNQWAIKEGVEIIDFSEDEEDNTTDTENIQIFASNSQKRIVEALQV